MGTATLHSLRDRMPPPATSRRGAGPQGGALQVRATEIGRVLQLAVDLFEVGSAALVLSGSMGLRVEALSAAAASSGEHALDAARRRLEVLAVPEPSGSEARRPAGVMEEVALRRGFVAATPVLSADGRCRGAICLLDPARKTLLTGLQRRLFAEFGDLVASFLDDPQPCEAAGPAGAVDDAAERRDSAALLQDLANREADAFALFDPDGRCLLRNRRFDALFGLSPGPAAWPAIPEARGCEAGWLALHLGRAVAPVALHRGALADGRGLCVEERRGPLGGSLVARVEARQARRAVERAA